MATADPSSRSGADGSPETESPAPTPSSLEENSPSHTNPMAGPTAFSTAGMTQSSTPLGPTNAARRPVLPQGTLSSRGGALPQIIEARMRAFHLGRQGAAPNGAPPSGQPVTTRQGPQSPALGPGGVPGKFQLPSGMARPGIPSPAPSARFPGGPAGRLSLAEKRGMKMPGGAVGGAPSGPTDQAAGRKKPMMKLSDMNGGSSPGQGGGSSDSQNSNNKPGSLLDKYSEFIDVKTGSLTFRDKARLTAQGVEFTSGKTFSISLDEVDTIDELGKGNYGTVWKVRHARPRMRRPGLGLAGNKGLSNQSSNVSDASHDPKDDSSTSGVVMAMKELRLELEDAKFAAIIMELDVLHRCVSPFIVDFYGAFFQEGAVYICMEWMDGGSIDKLYAEPVPETVLRKIALSTTMGLKSLKDEHNIIHRDVKPTNILVNSKGQVKICDFGVSGNLVASIAKTNIGCQSYMAPERISSGGVAQAGANAPGGTYSVQSDIWSLGLSIIECALGQYPYPPETYDNIFSQLSAIVDGEPPDLPADRFSEAARDFVRGCLMKIPKLRPTYAMLLQHAWLAPLLKPPTISEEDEEAAEKGEIFSSGHAGHDDVTHATEDLEVAKWVKRALERRRSGAVASKAQAPALHAAPLDSVQSPVTAS